jgi:hypothetical protein
MLCDFFSSERLKYLGLFAGRDFSSAWLAEFSAGSLISLVHFVLISCFVSVSSIQRRPCSYL